jgi:soluble lytic murein transglycosylase
MLWLGRVPDRAYVDAFTGKAAPEDSTLFASAYLAMGDTARALAWCSATPDTTTPAWEIIEARRLLLMAASGRDVDVPLLELLRRFPSSPGGRQCALTALRGTRARETMRFVLPHLARWPAAQRAEAWMRIAALHHETGRPDSTAMALWNAVETGAQPFASAAAETLARRRATEEWDERELETASAALLAGGKAHAALRLLPAAPISAALRLFRARSLLAAGRPVEGVAALRSMSRANAAPAADALWFLANHEKRVDEDSLAAERYHALVQRFPANSRAPDAAWESAWAFERIGQFSRAAVIYRDALRRWPHGPHADNTRFRWGLVAWRAGEVAIARERWLATWPHLRDDRAKAAVAYWVGKTFLLDGQLDEARMWWREAFDAAPTSFYGLRAEQRLSVTRLKIRDGDASSSARHDPMAWARTWNTGAVLPPIRALPRAVRLYDLGFATEAGVELQASLEEAGRSGPLVADVLRHALDLDSPGVVATAASRLSDIYRFDTGNEPPRWLDRLSMPVPFQDYLLPIAGEQELDPCLVSALIRKESYYDRAAISRAGAVGLMQLMPHTAAATARLASGLDPGRRAEVTTNLRLGCLHLRQVLDAHRESVIRALAAYNAGADPLSRWTAMLPTGDDELWVECITYSETRHYVKTVLAFTWRYQELWPDLTRTNPFAGLRVE